jgi:hypothetical protein
MNTQHIHFEEDADFCMSSSVSNKHETHGKSEKIDRPFVVPTIHVVPIAPKKRKDPLEISTKNKRYKRKSSIGSNIQEIRRQETIYFTLFILAIIFTTGFILISCYLIQPNESNLDIIPPLQSNIIKIEDQNISPQDVFIKQPRGHFKSHRSARHKKNQENNNVDEEKLISV